MIKIELKNCDLSYGEYDFKNDMDRVNEVKIDPREALKALEEQAPEVLREWAEKKYPLLKGLVNAWVFDERGESSWIKFLKQGPLTWKRSLSVKEIDVLYQAYALVSEGIYEPESPWIPVSEQEPPKDGIESLVKYVGLGEDAAFWVSCWMEFSLDSKGWKNLTL